MAGKNIPFDNFSLLIDRVAKLGIARYKMRYSMYTRVYNCIITMFHLSHPFFSLKKHSFRKQIETINSTIKYLQRSKTKLGIGKSHAHKHTCDKIDGN